MTSNAPYPGNRALPAEVKDRVLSTFQHSLQLFRQGNVEDAVVGCEFILKMDPLFEPATKLMAKAKDPSMNIDVENLVSQAGGDSRISEAAAAFQRRDFHRAMELASEVLSADPMNTSAQQLAEQAQERVEAAPFVQQFLQKCRSQIDMNNFDAARATLEKVRALDPTDPAIRECEQLIEVASTPSAPSGFSFGEPAAFGFGAPAANAPSSSFVVEEPPATAPPADFGFTFEETPVATAAPEVPSFGFSAEPQPPAAAPPTPPPAADGSGFDAGAASPFAVGDARTFDFTTAPTDISADDQMKISQYIAEGDAAYDSGDYPRAVDIWSRIFLIDVTNDEASQRIDKAKKKRAEAEENVDGLMIEATQAFERNDIATARTKFEEVLRIDPDNFNATQYLERINAVPAGEPARPMSPVMRGSSDILDEDEFGYNAPAIEEAPRVAPKQRPAAAVEKKAAPPGKPKGLLIGAAAAALIIILGGGWFAYSKFFGKAKFDPAKSEAIMTEAQSLAKGGKYDQAITALLAIQPDDPQHDKALEMIADLKKKKSEAAEMVDGRPAGVVFNESVANGVSAFQTHDYLGAKAAFEKAASIRPLPPEVKTMYDGAAQQVGKLDNALNHYKEGKYDAAIAALEPLLAADPENKSVKQLLINSHFNLGALALREDRDKDAMAEFDKVLSYDPADELATRSKEIITRYEGQPKDLLYRIYVKYLPVR